MFSFLLDSWEEPQDLSAKFGCSVSVGEHSFSQMEDDIDRQKLLGQPSHTRVGQPISDLDHLTLQVQVNNLCSLKIFDVPTVFLHLGTWKRLSLAKSFRFRLFVEVKRLGYSYN